MNLNVFAKEVTLIEGKRKRISIAQVKEVLKKLRVVLPIKFVLKEVEIIIPSEYAAKIYGNIIQFGKVLKDSWQDNGSWLGVIEIPGGLETDLYEKVNSLSSGNVEMKVIKIKE